MGEENKQLKEEVLKLDILLLRQEQRSRIDSIEVQGYLRLQMRSVLTSSTSMSVCKQKKNISTKVIKVHLPNGRIF